MRFVIAIFRLLEAALVLRRFRKAAGWREVFRTLVSRLRAADGLFRKGLVLGCGCVDGTIGALALLVADAFVSKLWVKARGWLAKAKAEAATAPGAEADVVADHDDIG